MFSRNNRTPNQFGLRYIFDRLRVRGRSIIVVIVVASSLALGGLLIRILPLIDVTITIAAVIGIALACWAADALGQLQASFFSFSLSKIIDLCSAWRLRPGGRKGRYMERATQSPSLTLPNGSINQSARVPYLCRSRVQRV